MRRRGTPGVIVVVADMHRVSPPSVMMLAIVVLSMTGSSQLGMISMATDGSTCSASESFSLAVLNSMSSHDSPIRQNS